MRDDFAKSRWVLYRGSGAAIYAGMASCRPIYVSLNDEISLDPLYLIQNEHKAIDDVTELKAIISDDLLLSEKEFVMLMKDVTSYCKGYFMPIDVTCLANQLKQD